MVVVWLAIDPHTDDDRQRLERALPVMRAGDPDLGVSADAASGQVRIGGVSEQHLEEVVHRLAREFGVAARIGRPQAAYKETLTAGADGEAKYVGTSDGRGQYGHAKIHVYPGPAGSGYVLEDDLTGG